MVNLAPIYCQENTVSEIEDQMCNKRFSGACSLVNKKDIIGIWERVGGSVSLKGITNNQVFVFTSEGTTTEKKLSAPYREVNKALPNFIRAGKWADYEFKDSAIVISTKEGAKISVMAFIFWKDISEEAARKELGDIGIPKKGDLLLIFPTEMVLVRKVETNL